MKTAISIPEAVFEEADRLARLRGGSRSELHSTAVAESVRNERFHGVRERLDAVYLDESADSRLESGFALAQSRSLPPEEW